MMQQEHYVKQPSCHKASLLGGRSDVATPVPHASRLSCPHRYGCEWHDYARPPRPARSCSLAGSTAARSAARSDPLSAATPGSSNHYCGCSSCSGSSESPWSSDRHDTFHQQVHKQFAGLLGSLHLQQLTRADVQDTGQVTLLVLPRVLTSFWCL